MASYNKLSSVYRLYYHINDFMTDLQKVKYKNMKRIVSQKLFTEFMKDYFQFIADCIVDGKTIVFPEGIGKVRVIGKEINPIRVEGTSEFRGITVNWAKTKKLWDQDIVAKEKRLLKYNFNEHSEGYTFKVEWDKGFIKTSGESVYTFRIYRQHKRRISKNIFEGKEYLKY